MLHINLKVDYKVYCELLVHIWINLGFGNYWYFSDVPTNVPIYCSTKTTSLGMWQQERILEDGKLATIGVLWVYFKTNKLLIEPKVYFFRKKMWCDVWKSQNFTFDLKTIFVWKTWCSRKTKQKLYPTETRIFLRKTVWLK